MADKVSAWMASDGTLFLVEQDAKDHDFEAAFNAWTAPIINDLVSTTYESGSSTTVKHALDDFVQAMIDDRMKLLTVFKLLNGGTAPTAPVKPDNDLQKITELSTTK